MMSYTLEIYFVRQLATRRGNCEQRTEMYVKYFEGAAQRLTKYSASIQTIMTSLSGLWRFEGAR
jgi:hypothetical protein